MFGVHENSNKYWDNIT